MNARIAPLAMPCVTTVTQGQLTLIQRSTGRDAVDREEGHTELELGDVNGDCHPDIVSLRDRGNPNSNSIETGISCYLGDGADSWAVQECRSFGYGAVAGACSRWGATGL